MPEPIEKTDILAELAQAAKATPEQIKQMAGELRQNRTKLEACVKPHEFRPTVPKSEEKTYDSRAECTKCQGWVYITDAIWYEKGLMDGKAASAAATPKTPLNIPPTDVGIPPEVDHA